MSGEMNSDALVASSGMNTEDYDDSVLKDVENDKEMKDFEKSVLSFAYKTRKTTVAKAIEVEEPKEQVYHADYKAVLMDYAIHLFYILCCGVIAFFAYAFYWSAVTMRIRYSAFSLPVVILLLTGIGVLVLSSMSKYWNYHKNKKRECIILLLLLGIIIYSLAFALIRAVIVVPSLFLDPNQWVTADRWMIFFRLYTVYPAFAAASYLTYRMGKVVFDPLAMKDILGFRLRTYLNPRKNAKWCYDLHIVRHMENGKYRAIYEKDRYLHAMANGGTGTGKTSSTVTPAVNEDMNKRCANEDALARGLVKMLESGTAHMTGRVTPETPFYKVIVPDENNPKAVKKHKELLSKHRLCGIMVIAPDSYVTDDIAGLARAKSIPCHVIDPIPLDKESGLMKRGYIGFNPFHISPDTPRRVLRNEIAKRAALFADVLQQIDDMRGKGDPYFTNLNRCMTVAFSMCLMATFPYMKGHKYPGGGAHPKEPTPRDLRNMVDDFDLIEPYYNKLKEIDPDGVDYGFVARFIALDIFGEGRTKMIDQARGLRVLLDLMLADPSVEALLSPSEEEGTVDFDRMLANGEVAVVNYAEELGDSNSKTLGLVILLSFLDAVFRRPGVEKTRSPFFLFVDELPNLLHPRIEQALSQFRKFRCALFTCIQSISQFEKSTKTAYMKKSIPANCAHIILFGHCSPDDMEYFKNLFGERWVEEISKSTSETSITDVNPTISFSERSQLKKQDAVDASSLRYRAFQEVTLSTVANNNLLPPIHGKVDFLDPRERNRKKRYIHSIDWDKMYEIYCPIKILDENVVKDIENDMVQPEELNIPAAEKGGNITFAAGNSADVAFEDEGEEWSVELPSEDT